MYHGFSRFVAIIVRDVFMCVSIGKGVCMSGRDEVEEG